MECIFDEFREALADAVAGYRTAAVGILYFEPFLPDPTGDVEC